ncbi:MAG: hypothetical protein ACYC6O_05140 [Thermoleophilia bacterium]
MKTKYLQMQAASRKKRVILDDETVNREELLVMALSSDNGIQ